jgi:hypothetical protein
MRFFTSLLLFLGIGSGLHVFAGTIDPNTPDSKYVEFGKQFPSVVKIHAETHVPELTINGILVKTDKDGPPIKVMHNASAVIIQPHWILTAAHVVEGATVQYVEHNGEKFPLAAMILHPQYTTDIFGHYDLALGYSPKDFRLEFYTPLYNDSDEVAKTVTIAGFGWHGTFVTGGQHYDGRKRAGSNRIAEIDRGALVVDADGPSRTALEFLICPGDSGGGLFIGDKLAGINSFLMATDKKPDGTRTDKAAFTRVSLYTAWVQQEIAKYELALKTESQPESNIVLVDKEVQP